MGCVGVMAWSIPKSGSRNHSAESAPLKGPASTRLDIRSCESRVPSALGRPAAMLSAYAYLIIYNDGLHIL